MNNKLLIIVVLAAVFAFGFLGFQNYQIARTETARYEMLNKAFTLEGTLGSVLSPYRLSGTATNTLVNVGPTSGANSLASTTISSKRDYFISVCNNGANQVWLNLRATPASSTGIWLDKATLSSTTPNCWASPRDTGGLLWAGPISAIANSTSTTSTVLLIEQ